MNPELTGRLTDCFQTYLEASEEVGFSLVVQPRDRLEQEKPMTFKLHGKNMETVGTCLFFAEAQSGGPSEGREECPAAGGDPSEESDVEMSDSRKTQSSQETRAPPRETQDRESDIAVNRTCKSKLVCIGKCKKVVQAFIED